MFDDFLVGSEREAASTANTPSPSLMSLMKSINLSKIQQNGVHKRWKKSEINENYSNP